MCLQRLQGFEFIEVTKHATPHKCEILIPLSSYTRLVVWTSSNPSNKYPFFGGYFAL